jgi:predicted dithiol-disulfide oxidoreductase (DUF899 family)
VSQGGDMDIPRVVSQGEWLAARKDLLAREKEATHAQDAVDAARRALPMTEVTKDYIFTGPGGQVSLADLFDGRRQLITYHFMWRHAESGFPGEDQGCPTCSFLADSIGHLSHLHACDTTLVLVSRAPIASIERFRKRMGWAVPWYSSYGSDFNYDFHATLDAAVAPVLYNYRTQAELVRLDPEWASEGSTEMPGFSCFLRDGDAIFHTYSTYARGTEQAGADTYALLDLTALGRQEDWEEPVGRAVQVNPGDPRLLLTDG